LSLNTSRNTSDTTTFILSVFPSTAGILFVDSIGAQKYMNEYISVYEELNKSVTLSDLTNAWQTGQYFHLVTDKDSGHTD
jgi:hypothetical protein